MPRVPKYRCSYCGLDTRYTSYLKQMLLCKVCMRPLCTACYHAGFCAEHFAHLTSQEQDQASRIYARFRERQKKEIVSLLSAFVVLFAGMIITIVIVPPLAIIPVVLGFCVLLLLILEHSIKVKDPAMKSLEQQTWLMLDEIGKKYRSNVKWKYTGENGQVAGERSQWRGYWTKTCTKKYYNAFILSSENRK